MSYLQDRYRRDAALDITMRKVVEYDHLRTMKQPPKVEQGTPIPPNVTQKQHEMAIRNYREWKADRAELHRLEECASTSAVKVVGLGSAASALAFLYSRKFKFTRGRTVWTTLLAGAAGCSLAFQKWGTQCAIDFVQGDGRIAAKARDWLREEYEDHPILKEYEATHSQPPVEVVEPATTS